MCTVRVAVQMRGSCLPRPQKVAPMLKSTPPRLSVLQRTEQAAGAMSLPAIAAAGAVERGRDGWLSAVESQIRQEHKLPGCPHPATLILSGI